MHDEQTENASTAESKASTEAAQEAERVEVLDTAQVLLGAAAVATEVAGRRFGWRGLLPCLVAGGCAALAVSLYFVAYPEQALAAQRWVRRVRGIVTEGAGEGAPVAD